jgi:hypothetical protein
VAIIRSFSGFRWIVPLLPHHLQRNLVIRISSESWHHHGNTNNRQTYDPPYGSRDLSPRTGDLEVPSWITGDPTDVTGRAVSSILHLQAPLARPVFT